MTASPGWASMTQTGELSASDGAASSDFGFSSAISGNTVVVGAVNARGSRGEAYVFVEPAGDWTNITQAAISGNLIVVGAPGATVGSNQLQGAAYIFIEPPGGWKNTSRSIELTASDGAASDNLGVSVGASLGTFVAGAPKSTTPGEAYVFGP